MLKPKLIQVGTGDQQYRSLIGGPPESVSMRSGVVVLQPGEAIGEHNTESYEELVIILEGEGVFSVSNAKQFAFNAGSILYCPPRTQHNVENTGSIPLRYIYVVAKAE